MSIALMHRLDAEIAAVEHIGPGGNHAALMIKHRVVEVEADGAGGEASDPAHQG